MIDDTVRDYNVVCLLLTQKINSFSISTNVKKLFITITNDYN